MIRLIWIEVKTICPELQLVTIFFILIFNRPGVAGSVLQTALWLTDSYIHSVILFLQILVAEVEQVSPLSLKRCVSAWVGARNTELCRKVLSYFDFSLICILNRVLGGKNRCKTFEDFWQLLDNDQKKDVFLLEGFPKTHQTFPTACPLGSGQTYVKATWLLGATLKKKTDKLRTLSEKGGGSNHVQSFI